MHASANDASPFVIHLCQDVGRQEEWGVGGEMKTLYRGGVFFINSHEWRPNYVQTDFYRDWQHSRLIRERPPSLTVQRDSDSSGLEASNKCVLFANGLEFLSISLIHFHFILVVLRGLEWWCWWGWGGGVDGTGVVVLMGLGGGVDGAGVVVLMMGLGWWCWCGWGDGVVDGAGVVVVLMMGLGWWC